MADADLQLPVGLTEAYLPALDQYRTPQPSPTRTFSLPCGKGPDVTVDGTRHRTGAKGTVRDLVERRPIAVTLCGRAPTSLPLPAGTHTLETPQDKGPLRLTDATLTRTDAPTTTPPAGRALRIRDWLGDRKEVTIGSGPATYLTTYENANDGWKATLGGKELTPLRLDGWQQGFLVPQGAGGTVQLSYEPARTYEAGLFGGAAGVLALAGIALFPRRAANTDATPPAPPPGLLLGTVALTLVGAVIAGPLALLVPALALVAWRRHALLVPIAFLAMAGAGIAAAVGAGEPSRSSAGAFGPAAQLLALVALFAALTTTRGPARTPADPPRPPGGPSQEGSA